MSAVPEGDDVPGWKRTKGWHPRLTLHVQGPPDRILDVLARCLDGSRFTIKDRQPGSFRARYIDWFGVAAGTLEWTRLAVGAEAAGGSTTVTIEVESGQEQRAGRRNAVQGLSRGVAELRGQGLPVTTGTWVYPEG